MNQDFFQDHLIETRITLTPEQFSPHYQDSIVDIIRDKLEKKCIKNYGYVDRVKKIHKIINEEIMKMTPNVYFLVEVEIFCYLPKIGDRLDILVEFVFNHGIFGAFEKIKVLVPIQSCQNWEFLQEFTELILFEKDNPHNKIRKGDIITIEIQNIRFEKENYSCLGKIFL